MWSHETPAQERARELREAEEWIRVYGAEHHFEARPVCSLEGTWESAPPIGEWHLFYDKGLLGGWFRGCRYDVFFPWRIATRAGIHIAGHDTLWLPMPEEGTP